MSQARPKWIELYEQHHAALGTAGLAAMLDHAAERWQLGSILQDKGVIVFPHAAVYDCGIQTAAAVNAVFDSGVDKVLVVGVLHGWTAEMQDARDRVANGEDFNGHPMRGIHGPDITNSRPEWQLDHSLVSWRHFWQVESARRGRTPANRECFPFLAGTDPTSLPNYDEIARWSEDAMIVATADMFHHGIGYGDTPEQAAAPDSGGLDLARDSIARGNSLLADQDISAYLQHCLVARSDARDAGPFFRSVRNVTESEILDLRASDMAEIYGAPPPTWVAAALVTWQPA